MPPKSQNQRVAAIIAEKVKSGQMKGKPGMPSTKMAKMPASSLADFAQANIPSKKKKKKGALL